MLSCTWPALVSTILSRLAAHLDRRTQPRFWSVFFGLLMCRERRRTVTAWFRAAGIGKDFRQAYLVLGSVGRRVKSLSSVMLTTVESTLGRDIGSRFVFAFDDTVTKRYGPCVEGAGIHHNPTPGPAAQEWVYGHVWVTLVWVVHHSLWGAIGLPVRAALYVRKKDLGAIPEDYEWKFRTKLELAVEIMQWLKIWLEHKGKPIWLLMDGAYAKQIMLRAAKELSMTIVSRLRHDSALWTLPDAKRPKSTRGRKPKYGKRTGRRDHAMAENLAGT